MSKNKRSGDDHPRPQRWVKFVGKNADQWKRTLTELNIEKIPFNYVNDVRLHNRNGKIHVYDVKDSDESFIETLVEKACNDIGNIAAVEYVIDLDQLHVDIATQVKILLKGSKDD